jgi:hypothetical protein
MEERSGIAWSWLGMWKLKGEAPMPSMRGEGERVSAVVEASRMTEVEMGIPEQQMATYQRGNRTQEDAHWQRGQITEKCRYLLLKE